MSMTNLLWVLQKNLFIENERDEFMRVLERFDLPYQLVDVGAGDIIDPPVTHDGPIITNGSIRLSVIANQMGWYPGSMFNENFDYSVWFNKLNRHLLNKDAVFTTLEQRPPFHMKEFFIRPVSDTKTFTGRVMKLEEFDAWKCGLAEGTPVLYSSIKKIGQEHRHFIVDGKVITSSRYKLNGVPNFTSVVDEYIIEYAESVATEWSPSPMFVLDTYVYGDEIGVVELGCMSHAGLYSADVQKLVMAIVEKFDVPMV